ncbi:MAG: response regulator transcription factor [Deltaproteobacteria bacterium]|nr:response regulator transcription factor [Deltaproteobacteria bacterium]
MRVLVVDDDPELAELLSQALARDGHRVDVAGSLAAARDAMTRQHDVLVLDVGLPDGSGLSLCRELRQAANATPILVLTARSGVAERVEGLDAGADDYLAKPFALAELRARVRALARRRGNPPAVTYESGEVRLDISRRRARRDGLEVVLTSREWAIVEALVTRRGRMLPRGQLLDEVWGEATPAAAKSLEVLIGRIRRKLGRTIIRTLRGQGYAID